MEFIARFPLDFPALRRLTKWMAFLKALLDTTCFAGVAVKGWEGTETGCIGEQFR